MQTAKNSAEMHTNSSVWILDDDRSIRWVLEKSLGKNGLATQSFESGGELLNRLSHETPDAIISDIRMPGIDGLELLTSIQQSHPELPVIIMTAHSDLESAVASYSRGAFEYLPKPFDIDEAVAMTRRALAHAKDKNKEATETVDKPSTEIIGEAPAMQEVFRAIGRLSNSNISVLINGESGTGKELVARAIHNQSDRADRAFLAVNCAGIPPDLMESEFFGHRKGSFTGAVADKPGLFQAANHGTLFLDEVADLPMAMQVKLLRAIQEKAVRPLGSQREEPIDVRLLCATHKDLAAEVAQGHFRQDLFYRINVIELQVPPLRERREDLPLLIRHILARLAQRNGTPAPRLTDSAMERLQSYRFPGNVRELENALERAFTLCDEQQIDAGDLYLSPCTASQGDDNQDLSQIDHLEDYLDNIERQAITQALEETRWNKTAAAKRLGLTFRSLRYRLKKLGLDD